MARCGISLFFIVVAVAIGVANCVSDASTQTATKYVPKRYGGGQKCGANEVWTDTGDYKDARCSPPTPRRGRHTLSFEPRCECPEGFCRNESEQCVRIEH